METGGRYFRLKLQPEQRCGVNVVPEMCDLLKESLSG